MTIKEKELIKRLLDTFVSYKFFIPKTLKEDVMDILNLANQIKSDYDKLLSSCSCSFGGDDKETMIKLENEIIEIQDKIENEINFLEKL